MASSAQPSTSSEYVPSQDVASRSSPTVGRSPSSRSREHHNPLGWRAPAVTNPSTPSGPWKSDTMNTKKGGALAGKKGGSSSDPAA